MARVRLSRQALADLRAIHAYIAEHDPAAAGRVVAAIEHTLSFLAEYPRLGRPLHTGRVCIVPRYRYAISYRLQGDTVEVRFIFHPSRSRET